VIVVVPANRDFRRPTHINVFLRRPTQSTYPYAGRPNQRIPTQATLSTEKSGAALPVTESTYVLRSKAISKESGAGTLSANQQTRLPTYSIYRRTRTALSTPTQLYPWYFAQTVYSGLTSSTRTRHVAYIRGTFSRFSNFFVEVSNTEPASFMVLVSQART
jgi:hypothetical protein